MISSEIDHNVDLEVANRQHFVSTTKASTIYPYLEFIEGEERGHVRA